MFGLQEKVNLRETNPRKERIVHNFQLLIRYLYILTSLEGLGSFETFAEKLPVPSGGPVGRTRRAHTLLMMAPAIISKAPTADFQDRASRGAALPER
jgi:hypothetical protein